MSTVPEILPDDVTTLKAMLAKQTLVNEQLLADQQTLLADQQRSSQRIDSLSAENRRYKDRVLTLTEQLNLAIANRYAASSEKCSPDQLRLFDEAESEALEDDGDDERVTIATHERKKRGRKPIPEHFPRVEIVYELDLSDRRCDHDGRELAEIGEVVSEQVDIIPAKVRVLRHVRKKYACDCGHCIKTAPMAPQPIPKSLASPGLLAHIAVSKYQDALPLYRQETILQRASIDIPRASMANWMIKLGLLVQPLINLMREQMTAGDLIQMDETTVQVLKEPGKTAQSTSYLWLLRGGPPATPIVLYHYDPGRGAAVANTLLEGFTGILQTYGYVSYNAVVAANGLTHVGCWAHARRKFDEALRAQGKGKQRKRGLAHRGLSLIGKLYRIEKQAKRLSEQDRYQRRQQQALPVLKEIHGWLETSLPKVAPKSATGKAMTYLNNEWPKLERYVEDGRINIDNNLAENAIRPFVVGRKNWLFSASVRGGVFQGSCRIDHAAEFRGKCSGGLRPFVIKQIPRQDVSEAFDHFTILSVFDNISKTPQFFSSV